MKRIQAPCSHCFANTRHRILRSFEHAIPRTWWPEDRDLFLETEASDEVEWRPDTFEIIECAGCGRVSFAHRYIDLGYSEDAPHAFFVERADYYPFPVLRRRPPWIAEPVLGPVPLELRGLFNEIY